MDRQQLLAYITGSVDQALLLRNEYLVTENHLLRKQITGRVRLSDSERTTLAVIGKKLGKHALEASATIVPPAMVLAWHRTLVAKKFDGSQPRPANEAWMMQEARNVTMEEWGLLSPGQHLIHDRGGKYCPAFQQLIDDAGVERVVLPPQSPNLNAYLDTMTLTRQCPAPGARQKPGDAMAPWGRETEEASRGLASWSAEPVPTF